MEFRVKKTAGKTWATLKNDDFVDEAFLKQIGELLVESIVYEAGKDFAKQGNRRTPVGAPEGIPRSVEFFNSFKYRIKQGRNGKAIEVYSTWPWIQQVIEGRRPYPMEWLTQQAGVSRVPMKQDDGTVLIRSTPVSADNAWIHPGFKKHTFIRRGYENARRKMKKLLADQVTKVLSGTNVA